MTHGSLAVLRCEHQRLVQHLRSLKTHLVAGRWRWPGAAQDRLRRLLQALLAHQRGLHRSRFAARLSRRTRHAQAAALRPDHLAIELPIVPLRDTQQLHEALALWSTLHAGDRGAAAPMVWCVLTLAQALASQLKAEAQSWLALPTSAAARGIQLAAVETSTGAQGASRRKTRAPKQAATARQPREQPAL